MRIFAVLVLVLTASPSLAYEEQPPLIVTAMIEGLVNADGSGAYVRLLQRAWGAAALRIDVLPAKRALKTFSHATEPTCFIPLSRQVAEDLHIDLNGKVFSKPFNNSFAMIIGSERSAVSSIGEIEDRVIGVLLGFPIAREVVAAAAHIARPNALDNLLKMLDKRRIDFAYVHYPDVSLKYPALAAERFPSGVMRFDEAPDGLACTKNSEPWVRRFDDAVDRMYRDGSIRDVLGSAFTGR